MKKWNSGGIVATPVTTETMTRVRMPCVAAYAMMEAMTHKLASSKQINPLNFFVIRNGGLYLSTHNDK